MDFQELVKSIEEQKFYSDYDLKVYISGRLVADGQKAARLLILAERLNLTAGSTDASLCTDPSGWRIRIQLLSCPVTIVFTGEDIDELLKCAQLACTPCSGPPAEDCYIQRFLELCENWGPEMRAVQ